MGGAFDMSASSVVITASPFSVRVVRGFLEPGNLGCTHFVGLLLELWSSWRSKRSRSIFFR